MYIKPNLTKEVVVYNPLTFVSFNKQYISLVQQVGLTCSADECGERISQSTLKKCFEIFFIIIKKGNKMQQGNIAYN